MMPPANFSRTLPKNSKEEIRVALTEYKQRSCADIRIYVHKDEGKVPTKNGVCILVEQLPALRQALQEAEAEARRLGFLSKEAA